MSLAEYGYGALEERAQPPIRQGGVLVEFEERKNIDPQIKINTGVRRDRPAEMYFGRKVSLFRKEVGLFQFDLAEQIGIPTTMVHDVERGKTKEMRLQVMQNLVSTVEKHPESHCAANLFEEIITSLDATPGNNKEVIAAKKDFEERAERFEKEKLKREEDKNWLPVIQKVGIHRAITFLRLSSGEGGQSLADFAKDNSLPYDTVKNTEDENYKYLPSAVSLRRIIAGTELHPEGKAAQLLYLQASDRKSMSVSDLRTATFGKLVIYLRIAKGVSSNEAAKELYFSRRSLYRVENDRYSLREGSIINALIAWLEPDAMLKKILEKKAKRQELTMPSSEIAAVCDEKYLFTPSVDEIKRKRGSQNLEIRALKGLTVGEIIKVKRKERNLTSIELTRKLNNKSNNNHLDRIQRDKWVASDTTIARIMIELGYNIYDPVPQLVFEKAQKERLKRRQSSAGRMRSEKRVA